LHDGRLDLVRSIWAQENDQPRMSHRFTREMTIASNLLDLETHNPTESQASLRRFLGKNPPISSRFHESGRGKLLGFKVATHSAAASSLIFGFAV